MAASTPETRLALLEEAFLRGPSACLDERDVVSIETLLDAFVLLYEECARSTLRSAVDDKRGSFLSTGGDPNLYMEIVNF